MGILCKMNQDQNSMGFFCKVFCWKKERKKKRKERKIKGKKERKACCTPTYDARYLHNHGDSRGYDWVTEKKSSFNFAENWLRRSSRYINVRNFRVLVKQLSYGNKIQFQVWKLGKIYKGFPCKKKGSLILLKLGTHKVHNI